MLKFKIYFTIKGVQDYFTVEAETVEIARVAVAAELERRGFNKDFDEAYSEQV